MVLACLFSCDFVVKMSQEMCRLCLSSDELKPIFPVIEQSEKYTTVLELITGLKIQANDGLPQQICQKCTDLINTFLKFRNQCHLSELELLRRGYKRPEPQIKEENKVETINFSEDFSTDYSDFKTFKIEVELDRITQDVDEKSNQEPDELQIPKNVLSKTKNRKEIRQIYLSLVEGEFVPNGPVKCNICKKSFKKWTTFKNHARKHLGAEIDVDLVKDKEDGDRKNKPFKIANTEVMQPKKKSRKEMKELYLNLVEGEFDPNGPVKCKVCKITLNKWNSFINHARKHLGFKFVCEFCGKSFVSSNQLKRHCRSFHGMERELKCKYCNYLALDTPQLRVHERREHTGERPYVCDLCAAAYFSRKCLLQHIESHRTTASVQCDKCSMSFKSRRHLAKHVYGTHSDKRRERRRERRAAIKNAT